MTETAPYKEWTLDDLRDELRARQLPTSGNKPELVERLEDNDEAPPADPDAADDDAHGEKAAKPAPAAKRAPGECVVDDGTPHTGRAVNGVICSAHAMRYKADGTRRSDG